MKLFASLRPGLSNRRLNLIGIAVIWMTIIAAGLTIWDLRQEAIKTMYIPWMQIEGAQPSNCNSVVRVSMGDPMRLAPVVEKLIHDTDAGLRLRSIQAYSVVL